MQIPDLQQYKDKFSQEAFTDKIARIAKRSGAKLVYAALVPVSYTHLTLPTN